MLFTTVLFYVLALVMVVAAYRVIAAKNPVTAVLHLILVLITLRDCLRSELPLIMEQLMI